MACGGEGGGRVHETPEVTMPHPKHMCNFDGKDVIASKHSQLKTWNKDRFRMTKLGSSKITFLLRKSTSPYCMYIYSNYIHNHRIEKEINLLLYWCNISK